MNDIDLQQFQFDYDQTWAVMFCRHDGTVLARYGTRGDKEGMTYNSMDGFTSTMKRVLQVDQNWTSELNDVYAAKRGPEVAYQTANKIPSKTISGILVRDKQGKESCIHCHNVYDGLRDVDLAKNRYDPARRYKYPLPENLGLNVDSVSGNLIEAVVPGSAAAKASVEKGQTIVNMNRQPIHSLADIQFVLHHLGEKGSLDITLRDKGQADSANDKTVRLALQPGWRVGDIGWRASMYGMPPKPGLWVQAASDQEKRSLRIPKSKLALNVRGIFGRDVRRSGLRKGDVIIEFDGKTAHHAEGAFHAHLRLNHFTKNSKMPIKVLRNGKTKEIVVTFVN